MARMAAEEAIQRDAEPTTWTFEINMHPRQLEIFEHPARFKVVAAGRRFGKTMLAAIMVLLVATRKADACVLWVSPSHSQSKKAMRIILRWLRQVPRRMYEVNRTDQEIFLNNGSIIMFRSAERFDNLRGDGLDFVVCDEAAFMPREAWFQAIRPALADKMGEALLISTFDGENWFYDLYRQAIDPDNVGWEGWRLPTSCNPYVPQSELDEARRNNPKEVYLQEFEASPIAYSGAVWPGERLDAAWEAGKEFEVVVGQVVANPDGSRAILEFEAGLDWGHNFTVLEVCQELPDGRIAWVIEQVFERIELREKCQAIAATCLTLGISCIYADAAGATENMTLAQILEEQGAVTEIQPVPFNAYKRPGVVARGYYLERGREVLTPGVRQLYVDSKAYHYDGKADSIEKYAKGNDHTVDAATAFYASRAHLLGAALEDTHEEAA